MRFVLWTGHAKAEISSRLRQVAGVDLVLVEDVAGLAREIVEAEALACTDFVYGAETAAALRGAKRLRWIQLITAGYENAQLHGVPPGVVLTNTGDALSPAVAAHAVSMLLALQRRFPQFIANQARQAWDRSMVPLLATPAGNTIVIVGFGSIGREVARLLRPFGGRTIGVSRSGAPHPLADEVVRAEALASLLPRADAIVLSLPLSGETENLIGAPELAAMKRNAVLVNIARGGVVDHVALADALTRGIIAGAGLDVTEPEPLPKGHPLWAAPNLILSPHLAGACGPIGLKRLADVVGDNMERFAAGKPLAYVVTLPQR